MKMKKKYYKENLDFCPVQLSYNQKNTKSKEKYLNSLGSKDDQNLFAFLIKF